MKPTIITSFAAGLLLATSVSGIVYFSTKDDSVKAEENKVDKVDKVTEDVANTPTVEEMKEILTSSGYVVQTSEEAKQKEEEQKQASESNTSEEKKEDKEEEQEEEVKTVTVTVSSGMTSYDVGSILHDEKIIKETALEFSQKVDKKGVAEYLKLGSFKIKSDMSTDEIISKIFKKQS